METVSFLHQIMLSLQTLDVAIGTGTKKYVYLALKVSYSMRIKSVLHLQINARLPVKLEIALHASKVMICKKVFVLSQLQTMPSLLNLDALHGTGITKSVSNAQKDGSSVATTNVCQLMINAHHLTQVQELALPATLDTS